MKTFSFIGSDKNAGKTTVLNFVCKQILDNKELSPLCLTSIGINGESIDNYDGLPKPTIDIPQDVLFLTAGEHLTDATGKYETLHVFSSHNFLKPYVLGRSLYDQKLVLEGPNNKEDILEIKKTIIRFIENGALFIDGSIDRQFLGHPDISDEFFFALLITNRSEQLEKAKNLLYSISIPECQSVEKKYITSQSNSETKSLLFNEKEQLLYSSSEIPSLDNDLLKYLFNNKNNPSTLYLNGALTKSLLNSLASYSNLKIILNNFTQYQNISLKSDPQKVFRPQVILLHPVNVTHIFLNEKHPHLPFKMPRNIPISNLYREELNEIRI